MAVLRLGALFSDHMVLERDRQNPIWGWDEPGQAITLTVLGAPGLAPSSARAAADGSFTLSCPALSAGGPEQSFA